jgi:hypothetical protein
MNLISNYSTWYYATSKVNNALDCFQYFFLNGERRHRLVSILQYHFALRLSKMHAMPWHLDITKPFNAFCIACVLSLSKAISSSHYKLRALLPRRSWTPASVRSSNDLFRISSVAKLKRWVIGLCMLCLELMLQWYRIFFKRTAKRPPIYRLLGTNCPIWALKSAAITAISTIS